MTSTFVACNFSPNQIYPLMYDNVWMKFDFNMKKAKKYKMKAPTRFELVISCLLDRRFNQLSHSASTINLLSGAWTTCVQIETGLLRGLGHFRLQEGGEKFSSRKIGGDCCNKSVKS